MKLPGWAAYLGAASYSIYLVHTYLLGWFGKVAARLVSPGAASGDGLYFIVSALRGRWRLFNVSTFGAECCNMPCGASQSVLGGCADLGVAAR